MSIPDAVSRVRRDPSSSRLLSLSTNQRRIVFHFVLVDNMTDEGSDCISHPGRGEVIFSGRVGTQSGRRNEEVEGSPKRVL